MRAATYVRLSASRLGEDAPGLDRQREATERLVRERGWELAGRYQDADTSAFREGVARPGFEDLRRAVEEGDVGAVVVWKLDRLFRRLREGADFLDECRSRNVALVSVQEGVDTSTEYGGMLFAIFASLGEIESQGRSDRITAWHRQRAKEGEPAGGGSRPFGFKEGGIKHEPSEVRMIRKAARDLLAGASLRSVARAWTEAGVPTTTGRGRWTTTTVRRLMLSPRVAGLREHGGKAYPAKWRPILTQEERLGLLALIDGRPGHNAGRRYLLTGGLAACGPCKANLVARPRGDGRRCYVCATDQGGCGKIRILAAPLEEHVAVEVNRRWEQRQLEGPVEPEPAADDLRRMLAADEAALEELAKDRYVARTISAEEFRAARGPLVERIAETQERLSRGPRRRTYLQHLDELPPAPWEAPPGTDPDPEELASWRRHFEQFVERVVVGPAVRGRNRFDPGRVQIEWASRA